MSELRWQGCARTLHWLVYRNPMYLFSAACMAAGARMLLVSPSTRAGDVGLILLTFGVLQLYESLVSTIIIALHRSRRSPEDLPSLLLVAAMFWTGPFAATAEMTAQNRRFGLPFALVACLIALTEMAIVRRQIGLRLSVWTRWAASMCIILIGIAPTFLKIPDAVNGTNELFLFLCWWLLAAVAFLGVGMVRCLAGSRLVRATPELVFFFLVLMAAAIQLYGMNYAFFGHAKLFYASPVLIALAAVAFTAPAQLFPAFFRFIIVSLPALAICLALSRFDYYVPVKMLPIFLRDPALPVLLLAAVVWWYGSMRQFGGMLMHAGNAALGWALLRIIRLGAFVPAAVQSEIHAPGKISYWVTIILYAITAYLLLFAWLRRSKTELLAAILVHQIAIVFLVWARTPADTFLIVQALGWHWLIAMHIVAPRPPTAGVLVAVLFLMFVGWGYDFDSQTVLIARYSGGILVAVLLGVGWIWHSMRYRIIGFGVATAEVLFYTARGTSQLSHPIEATIVIIAFALLAMGVIISWYKRSLLRLVEPSALEMIVESKATWQDH